MHRYEWRIPKDEDPVKSQEPSVLWPTLKEFSKMATTDPDAGIDESYLDIKRTWEYTFHVRNCEKWKIGRVFLLGDAAHIMPPFAGQGMSAGIKDAANVVWKIKLVLAGRARAELLDTYQDERQKNVQDMTTYSRVLGALVMVRSPLVSKARDAILLTCRRIPGIRQYLLSLKGRPLPAIRTGFVCSARDRKAPTGKPFPNVDVGTVNGRMLLDDAIGYGVVVLGLDCDPRERLSRAAVEGWERLGARFMRIRSGTLIVGEDEIGDPVGFLYDWFQEHQARVAVIRPDRMVYGVDAPGIDLAPPFVEAAIALTPAAA
jgi:3-(3-hydroxy-phenyl)propionate hydroxylase